MSRRPRSGQASEYFFQLPLRLTDALKRGEISGTGLQIVTFLAAECWRNEDVALYEVGQLQRVLDFTRSRDSFLRELKGLRPKWIEFELGARQRKAVEFRLTGAAVRTTGDAPGANHGTDLRQSSEALRQSARDETPLADSVHEALQLAQRDSRSGTRPEEKRTDQSRSDTCDDDCGRDAEVEYGQLRLCRRCAATRKKTAATLRRHA